MLDGARGNREPPPKAACTEVLLYWEHKAMVGSNEYEKII